MIEQVVTGRKYRVLVDATTRLWHRLSFWTSSVDVEMGDGNSAETNLGAIKGITTSTNVGVTGYAADAAVVSGINTNVNTINTNMGGLRFGEKDGDYGYYTGAGADTFRPFKSEFTYLTRANWWGCRSYTPNSQVGNISKQPDPLNLSLYTQKYNKLALYDSIMLVPVTIRFARNNGGVDEAPYMDLSYAYDNTTGLLYCYMNFDEVDMYYEYVVDIYIA